MDIETLRKMVLALRPASVAKTDRAARVAARRLVCHLWCDIDAKRACPAASFTMAMSDGTTMPFRLWAEGVLGIREGGKAYATDIG